MTIDTYKNLGIFCPEKNKCEGFNDIVHDKKNKMFKVRDLICDDYKSCGMLKIRKQIKIPDKY